MITANPFENNPRNEIWLAGIQKGAISTRESFALTSTDDSERRHHLAVANNYRNSAGINLNDK